ncbi:MAG: hypothetical protein QW568_03395 [Candidatus Anstonellaceae archaeon]
MAKANLESGTCVLCGQEKNGIPAKQDAIVSAARKARRLLKIQPKRTIACSECLPECKKKRAEFEKKLRGYRIGAAVFFLILLAGSLAYGAFGLRTVLAGLVGAAAIAILPYAKYFPRFETTE